MSTHTDSMTIARRIAAMLAGAFTAFAVWNLITGVALVKPVGTRADATFVRTSKQGTYIQGLEGYAVSSINAEGLRGVDAAALPKGTPRILFLGDSFTEAFQVPENEAYPSVTAALLSAEGSECAGVNAGRSGAGPADYIVPADWYLATYEPQAVVVQFGDADFTDDAFATQQPFYAERTGAAIRFRRNDGFEGRSALLDALPEQAAAFRGVLELPVMRMAADNLGKRMRPSATAGAMGAKAPKRPVDRDLIEAVVARLAEAYPHLVVVYIPQAAAGEALSATPGPIEAAVAQICAQHEVAYVGAREVLAGHEADTGSSGYGFFNTTPGTGHLNADGHAALADAIAETLGEELAR